MISISHFVLFDGDVSVIGDQAGEKKDSCVVVDGEEERGEGVGAHEVCGTETDQVHGDKAEKRATKDFSIPEHFVLGEGVSNG